MSKCLSIAHRGYSSKHGDNNLISFREAINHSFDMIELDLQLSKDQQIIIHHDPHFKGASLSELTSHQLQKEGLITLDQLFDHLDYHQIKLNLELKGNSSQLPVLLINFLQKYQIDTPQIYLSSFNCQFISHLIELRQQYQFLFQIGLISCNHYSPEIRHQLLSNIDFFVLDYELLNQEIIDYCHQNQLLIFVFTNTDNFTYQYICNYHVDGIISNTKYWEV